MCENRAPNRWHRGIAKTPTKNGLLARLSVETHPQIPVRRHPYLSIEPPVFAKDSRRIVGDVGRAERESALSAHDDELRRSNGAANLPRATVRCGGANLVHRGDGALELVVCR